MGQQESKVGKKRCPECDATGYITEIDPFNAVFTTSNNVTSKQIGFQKVCPVCKGERGI